MNRFDKKKHKISKVLKKYWGYDSLKPKQIQIIEKFVNKEDVIGLLPTGYGKSMCYLIPPLITKKTIFIISPLISLMEDQKDKLLKRGIPVSALHGNNTNKDRDIFDIIDGKIKIVYMSPEFLVKNDGLDIAKSLVKNKKLGFLAVDESHCISVWGHDFRRDYLYLYKFRKSFPKIPILAVTATATKIVIDDIHKHLNMNGNNLISGNFDRPNLSLHFIDMIKENLLNKAYKICISGNYHEFKKTKKKCKLCKVKPYKYKYTDKELQVIKKKAKKLNLEDLNYYDIIKKYLQKYKEEDKIIIYINSRKEADEFASKLNKYYPKLVESYHAGMSKGMRYSIQNKFAKGDIKIIVSTIAFGMGIDQIVRAVFILGSCSSIEDYYQQIGRAGRDDKPADTYFVYDRNKIVRSINMTKLDPKLSEHYKKVKQQQMYNVLDLCETNMCKRRFILEYFKERAPKFFNCLNCSNCLKEKQDLTKEIYNYCKDKKDFDEKDNIKLIENGVFNKRGIKTDYINYWYKLIQFKKYKVKDIPDNLKINI